MCERNRAFFSVVIPVYNVAEYLKDCLESILCQTYTDMEVILVCGESTDSSGEICREYAKTDNRIRIYRQENIGLSGARNTGIEHAQGEYICFLDADDMLVSDALEKLYCRIQREKMDLLCFDTNFLTDTAVGEDILLESKKRYLTRKYGYPEMADCVLTGRELFCQMIDHDDFQVPVWLFCIRRGVLIKNHIGFVEGILAEDNLYSVQCYLAAERAAYMKDQLYVYRIRGNSLSQNRNTRWRMNSLCRIFYLLLGEVERYEDDVRVKAALHKYIGQIASEIRRVNRCLDDCEKRKKEDDAFLDLIHRGMGIGEYEAAEFDPYIYEEGFKSLIRAAENIVLYGAGYYGNGCREWLERNGFSSKIYGFAVSDAVRVKEAEQSGNKVYVIEELSELLANESTLVILSANIGLHKEMEEKCKSLGVRKLIRMDERIRGYILQESKQ